MLVSSLPFFVPFANLGLFYFKAMNLEVDDEAETKSNFPERPKQSLGITLLQGVLPALSQCLKARESGVEVSARDFLGATAVDTAFNAGLLLAITPDLQWVDIEKDPLALLGWGLKVAGVVLAPKIMVHHFDKRIDRDSASTRRLVKGPGYYKGK